MIIWILTAIGMLCIIGWAIYVTYKPRQSKWLSVKYEDAKIQLGEALVTRWRRWRRNG